MNNPLAVGRLFFYQQLSQNSTIVTTHSAAVWPRRPQQKTAPPYIFPSHAAPRLLVACGSPASNDNPLWDINLVGGRDAKLTDLDPIQNEIFATLDRKKVTMSDGNLVECVVVDVLDLPYDIEADQYPRYITRCRLLLSFNH